MDEIPHIRRYWAEGKREEEVKEKVEITALNLPGILRVRYVQIPAQSQWEETPAADACYVFNKGYGTVTKDNTELHVGVGYVLHAEANKAHKFTNGSQTQTLEFLLIDNKKEN